MAHDSANSTSRQQRFQEVLADYLQAVDAGRAPSQDELLAQYPDVLGWVVRLTPLYQGVALERGLILGHLEWTMLLNAAYLAVLGTVGLRVASGRLGHLMQP